MGGEAPVPLGGTAIKPVGWDRTGWEAFKYMLYDPDNGTVLTRTPLSWLKITVFYLIYYSLLTAFWIACLVIFFQTLPADEAGPRWKLDSGLIGKNPGVGLRPRNSDSRIDSQMFVLQDGDTNRNPSHPEGEGDLNADYARRVEKFMEVYQKDPSPADEGGFPGYQKFDPSTLGDCGTFPYGYVAAGEGGKVKPCIFIKLNNIWDWNPEKVECGKNEEGEDQDECPEKFKEFKDKQTDQDNIWIDCHGRNAADQEQLKDGITYHPATRSIPLKYFPYVGAKVPEGGDKDKVGYHPPLVAIQVEPRTPGQLVHVECRAYYRGVVHETRDKLGLVQFEVQVL